MNYRVRLGRAADAFRLAEIEEAAAVRFGDVGLAAITEDDPTETAEYERLIRAKLTWVAEAGEGTVVGLALAGIVDGEGYLAELSVHPDHGRQGLGRRLVEAVEDWAKDRGFAALSLTTFDDVPWNRPYYERLGFSVLEEGAAGTELRAVRENERTKGLDRLSPRVCMRKELTDQALEEASSGN